MSNYKNDIDFNKIVTWLIPLDENRVTLLALAKALCSPLFYVYNLSSRFSASIYNHLKVTPQVGSLKYYLNKKHDPYDRRIYIEDGVLYPTTSLFLRAEDKPVILRTRAENSPVHIGLRTETGYKVDAFRVRIPNEIKRDKEAIRAFVDKYRLAGKNFSVIEI
jgi:hypothetical protein